MPPVPPADLYSLRSELTSLWTRFARWFPSLYILDYLVPPLLKNPWSALADYVMPADTHRQCKNIYSCFGILDSEYMAIAVESVEMGGRGMGGGGG